MQPLTEEEKQALEEQIGKWELAAMDESIKITRPSTFKVVPPVFDCSKILERPSYPLIYIDSNNKIHKI